MTGMFHAIGRFARWIRLFRIGAVGILLIALAPVVISYLGYGPSPEQVHAVQRTLDSHAITLSVIRIVVYLVLVWYGPAWRGAQGEDLDRARFTMSIVATVFELVFVQRMFLF